MLRGSFHETKIGGSRKFDELSRFLGFCFMPFIIWMLHSSHHEIKIYGSMILDALSGVFGAEFCIFYDLGPTQ